LGLLITNDGYGTARNTRITSGQPEIIENEKGLLISFKIIGAQVDDKPVSHSLTVTFGDIQSQSTRVSRWLMTSTLKGTFSNYTATFENVNPLGIVCFNRMCNFDQICMVIETTDAQYRWYQLNRHYLVYAHSFVFIRI